MYNNANHLTHQLINLVEYLHVSYISNFIKAQSNKPI